MSLTLHDTTDWAYERFDWPAVMACIKTYTDRFPNDANPTSVIEDVARGRLTLWLVLDEAEKPVAAVLVSLDVIDATNWKRASVHGYGGTRGIEALSLLPKIEAWARMHGADEIEAVGRAGWRKLLGAQGYREDAVILRKRLT